MRAFISCIAWRAIPGPFSKRKRRLDSLEAAQGAPREPRRDSRGERSPWLPLETRPYSPVPTLQGPCNWSQKWRGTLRFLPQLEKRPSSIAPNSVVSREAPPNTTVSLNSQRLPEILVVPREKTPTGAAAIQWQGKSSPKKDGKCSPLKKENQER